MDVASIFLTLAVALLVGLFISRPFANRRAATEKLVDRNPASEEMEMRRSSLLAERDRVLNALQELDFDFTLGKVPEQDYPVQRAELLQKGADVLRQLDGMAGVKAASSAEDRVEAVVAARRADARQVVVARRQVEPLEAAVVSAAPAASRRPPAPAEDDIETEIAARRRARQEKAGGFCPKCGRPVAQSDRFCSKCGTTL